MPIRDGRAKVRPLGSESVTVYEHWKLEEAKFIYDWMMSRKLAWPTPSATWGGPNFDSILSENLSPSDIHTQQHDLIKDSEQDPASYWLHPFLHRERTMILAERTGDQKDSNTLNLVTLKVPNEYSTKEDHVTRRWFDSARDNPLYDPDHVYSSERKADQSARNNGIASDLRVVKRINHPGEVNRVVVLANRLAVTHSDSSELLIWDFDKQPHRENAGGRGDKIVSKPNAILSGHRACAPYALCTNERDRLQGNEGASNEFLVASGDDSGEVLVWNVNGDRERGLRNQKRTNLDGTNSFIEPTIRFHGGHGGKEVNDVALKPRCESWNAQVASVGNDGALCIWDSRISGQHSAAMRVQEAHDSDANAVDWSPFKDHQLVSGGQDSVVRLWDTRYLSDVNNHRRPESEYIDHQDAVLDVKWNPFIPGVFGSCSIDKTVAVWNTTTKHLESDISPRGAMIQNSSYSPELVFLHRGHQSEVVGFDWSCDKNDPWLISSVSEDETGGSTVQFWRILDLIYLPRKDAIEKLDHVLGKRE
eukprot:CAMPEP_0182451122 /NCGR_PEP_ID=MMETSP1172-20130603/43547_1 /TAXON_ID=708627 /ORGANISM="Timspurckia oligopyrenoides, Strain CCMP3278" /LENGTH=533 /DNA_ID=CAMNT_0024648865 /DNA_START=653 /DNA_END=2254 /DNA_ORIENTATION=-